MRAKCRGACFAHRVRCRRCLRCEAFRGVLNASRAHKENTLSFDLSTFVRRCPSIAAHRNSPAIIDVRRPRRPQAGNPRQHRGWFDPVKNRTSPLSREGCHQVRRPAPGPSKCYPDSLRRCLNKEPDNTTATALPAPFRRRSPPCSKANSPTRASVPAM